MGFIKLQEKLLNQIKPWALTKSAFISFTKPPSTHPLRTTTLYIEVHVTLRTRSLEMNQMLIYNIHFISLWFKLWWNLRVLVTDPRTALKHRYERRIISSGPVHMLMGLRVMPLFPLVSEDIGAEKAFLNFVLDWISLQGPHSLIQSQWLFSHLASKCALIGFVCGPLVYDTTSGRFLWIRCWDGGLYIRCFSGTKTIEGSREVNEKIEEWMFFGFVYVCAYT